MTLTRPTGIPAIEYRKGARRFQRCSRCQREREISSLVLSTERVNLDSFAPVMVGQGLCGILCNDCVHSVEMHIQAIFPDRHAFPFTDAATGELLPNPRCELGHPLVYAHDGSGMVCEQCAVLLVRERDPDFIG